MFSSPSTNAPTQYRTNNTYSTTFSGPIKSDGTGARRARNDAMAQAAFQGDTRQFDMQAGKGVQAGGKMQAYRSGIMGDAEAGKAYAQAQQEMFNQFSDDAAADLQFQERLSGERGWMRDLLLDKDQTVTKERMSAYKRFADVQLGEYERRIREAIAAERRKTEILGGLI